MGVSSPLCQGGEMSTLKKFTCLFMVFMAGGVTFANLAVMEYGVPTHYEASWGKIVFAVLLAIIFGIKAIGKRGW